MDDVFYIAGAVSAVVGAAIIVAIGLCFVFLVVLWALDLLRDRIVSWKTILKWRDAYKERWRPIAVPSNLLEEARRHAEGYRDMVVSEGLGEGDGEDRLPWEPQEDVDYESEEKTS